jgi:amidase
MPYPEVPVPQAAAGPLAGLSFAVKDLFDVAGYPTSGGQPFMLALSGIKARTAPTVQTLLDAGARFVGKTITDELAFSMNGQNAHFGSPITGAARRSASVTSKGRCCAPPRCARSARTRTCSRWSRSWTSSRPRPVPTRSSSGCVT